MRPNRRSRQAAKRLYRLCATDGAIDEGRARLVVERMVANPRHDSHGILAEFHRLLARNRERHTARVESAITLPVDLQADVRAALQRIYGPHLDVFFVQQPQVIGGMRVRVGDDVYDNTVRAALQSITPQATTLQPLPTRGAAPPASQTK